MCAIPSGKQKTKQTFHPRFEVVSEGWCVCSSTPSVTFWCVNWSKEQTTIGRHVCCTNNLPDTTKRHVGVRGVLCFRIQTDSSNACSNQVFNYLRMRWKNDWRLTRGEGRENGTVLSVEAVEVGVRDTGQNDLNVKLKMLRERDTKKSQGDNGNYSSNKKPRPTLTKKKRKTLKTLRNTQQLQVRRPARVRPASVSLLASLRFSKLQFWTRSPSERQHFSAK